MEGGDFKMTGPSLHRQPDERNCSPVTVAVIPMMEQENFASLMEFCVRTVSIYRPPHLPSYPSDLITGFVALEWCEQ